MARKGHIRNTTPEKLHPQERKTLAVEFSVLKDQTIQRIQSDPRKAAMVLTDWVNLPSKKKPVKKAG